MGKTTILTGLILTVLGLGLYLGTGKESVTAMIPAFIGAPILLCGLLSGKESRRAMVMHIAALFGVFGALGGLGRGIPQVIKGDFGPASLGSLVMGLICLFFVISCVKSFKAARATQ